MEVLGMAIYLVQHGKPVPKEENPDRPLSDQGRNDVEKMALILERTGISVKQIIHSGKTRARETAEILSSRLTPGRKPLARKGLAPLDDVKETAKGIDQGIMIVGHLPHLAGLAAYLITGDEGGQVVRFQQGGVACLEPDDDPKAWAISWMLVPDLNLMP